MTLIAWPQVAAPNELQLWVGQFGSNAPAAPAFTVNGQPAAPLAPAAWFAIRDQNCNADGSVALNHQAVIRLAALGPDQPHRVGVAVGAERTELVVRSMPAAVPMLLSGSFNLLLCSCYFQPEDAGGLLGRIVSQLPVQPHMTLLGGDQVYLDLPLFEAMPKNEAGMRQAVGDKYRRNWMSGTLGVAGLQSVLTRAPTLCIADDHEFWNNYPFRQAQLPTTWEDGTRCLWAKTAQALYEDYQIGGAPGHAPGARRVEIDPLSMLLIDTRCSRTAQVDLPQGLMVKATQDALDAWASDLITANAAGQQRVGLLGTGQALLVPKPGNVASHMQDAELGSYTQSGCIEQALTRLAEAGVPVVFLTGDVHWGRVARARHAPSGRTLLYEVICSPSRLIDSPGADQIKHAKDLLHNPFGPKDPWPRHSDPAPVPARYGAQNQFAPESVFQRKGDQIALLQFNRAGRGLDMQVTYYAIHTDPAIARPETCGPHTLLAH